MPEEARGIRSATSTFRPSDTEEAAPAEVEADEVADVGCTAAREDEVIGEAEGGYLDAGDFRSATRRCCPAVEGFEEDVEEVGAGGASLGEAVGGVLGVATDVTIAEAAADGAVEGLEAVHRESGHSAQGAEDGPPHDLEREDS